MTYKLLPALGVALSALVMTGCGQSQSISCTPNYIGSGFTCTESGPLTEAELRSAEQYYAN